MTPTVRLLLSADVHEERIFSANATHIKNIEYHPPNWEKYGKSAGPIRNEEMAQNADALIAFPLEGVANKGTVDMIRRAEHYNLLVRVIQ